MGGVVATQIEEESEQKSLGFKTLLRKTLRAYLQLNEEIRKKAASGEEWQVGDLDEPLNGFFALYQELVGDRQIPGKMISIKSDKTEKEANLWKIQTDTLDIEVSRSDLIKIYEIFESQRQLLLTAYENEDFEIEDTHFYLHGEEITITSMLSIEADRLINDNGYDFNYTFVEKPTLQRGAIEAIRKDGCENYIGNGLKLKSTKKIHYILTPISSIQNEITFGYRILNLQSYNDKSIINENKYYIRSIINNNFTSICDLLRSIIIEYFIEHGDFGRFSICNQCDSLYLEQQNNYTKYCSRKCTRAHYEDSIIKEKSNCRERQRNWYNPRCVGIDKISIRSNECDSCELNHKRNGGDCNVLWEKYSKNILEWFEVEKGESAYSYMCRQKQLSFYSEQLGRSKTTMGNKSTCKNCTVCLPKEGGEIIAPGECVKILEKPKRKSKARIGMESVVNHTKNLGTDYHE